MAYRGPWEAKVEYYDGDVVQYDGHYYEIIQPHKSQDDWPPTIVALWKVLVSHPA